MLPPAECVAAARNMAAERRYVMRELGQMLRMLCSLSPLQSARLAPPVLLVVEPTGQATHDGLGTVVLPPADHVPTAQVAHWPPPVPGQHVSA